MLKKLIKNGKWRILSILFATISLVSLTAVLSMELATNFSATGKDPIDVSTEYNDDYFNDLLNESNQFDESLLEFVTYTDASQAPDGETLGQWLVGIKMTGVYSSIMGMSNEDAARAKYFETHSLVIPEIHNGYPVIGVDLLTFRNKTFNEYRAYAASFSMLKALYIPDSVRKITTASFVSMTSLEYLRIPFVGIERGSSGKGINYTIQDVMKNGGVSTPTSYSFGSMFGTPFDYNRANESPWSAAHTDQWYYWTWNDSSKTTGYVSVVDYTQYLNRNEECEVLGVRWAEISGEEANSHPFEYLVPRSLQKVIISDDHIIGNNAFTSCTMRQLEIPDFSGGSLLFGNYAFSECVDLKEVKLPTKKNVSFRKGTFNYCQSLESLVLPPSITEIPDSFLYNALNLKTVIMPASIIGIGNGSFRACQNLEHIALYSGDSSAGITGDFDVDKASGLIQVGSYDFNLPAGLQRIGENAFQDCQNLKELNVPVQYMQTIGYAAFGGCYNLKTIVLPFIGAHSDNCGGANCKNECSTNKLGGDTQYHSLFGWIFGDVGGLDRFYIAQQQYRSTYGDIESKSFYIPKTLENVTIRNERVISIGALQNLSSIVNLTVNAEVGGNVATGSLTGCSNLVSLSISSIGSHLGNLFAGSNFENSLVTKGSGRVPSTLTTIAVTNQYSIPTDAFYNCTRLENVTIGNNTQYMDSAIFYNNENLTTLTIPFAGYERGEFWRRWWWWRDKAIRNSVSWLFSSTYHPNTYANKALGDWSGYIRYIPTRLKSLTVTSETEIDTYAFRNMSSLESISITNIPDHMESYSFSGCSGLQELNIPYVGYDLNRNGYSGGTHTLGYIFGSAGYAGSYTALQYGNSYQIPGKLAIVKVGAASGRDEAHMSSKVFDQAFMNCKSITTIDFYGAYINELGTYAFANCTNLSQVNYPNANYTHVGNYAFYNCPKVLAIEDFTPDTIRTIGHYAFYATSVGNKTQVGAQKGELILDQFTYVGDYAFGKCLQIEKVDIPASLTYVGKGLFSGCSYLSDVTLTNNKNVSAYMFEDCISLVGIDLSGITSIPEGLLSGCTNLEMDTEYNNGLIYDTHTTYIGKYAFRGCRSLENFILNNTLTTIDEGAFQGCTGLEYMTVPRETTVIRPYGWIGCNDNFFFYVYEPEEYWSKGWVNNWNCDYPVYVLGAIDDDIYTYVFDVTEKKFYITGLTPNATLNGVVTIPTTHNGIQVVGIDESRRTTEDIAAGAKDIKTQTGITKVILPKSITKVSGDPFATGFRVDIYTELTKAEVTNIYNASAAALEKEYAAWIKAHPNSTETESSNAKVNIFNKIKGWLPFAENARDGIAYATSGENSWDQRYWISGGFLYYRDYWQYGTGVTYNVPYLNINTFKYTLSSYDNHYTG
ncbi:MAG: leucine-rich repeat domain-containing protein, partial [Anaeroplasmataceae bacterium]|nr:leucine-rich repeat domain-containing protein [Anaeroplasmataceae bacterium]